MKNKLKTIGIIAFTAIIGFTLISCGTSGGGSGGGAAAAGQAGFTHNLGTPTLKVLDNFQYGEGYQVVFSGATLLEGKQFQKGDKYTLMITFTASRDLEAPLFVGLVDPSEAANYWRVLSYANAPGIDPPNVIEAPDADGIIKAGQVISATIDFEVVVGSTGRAASRNGLFFQTRGAGTRGSANSGKLGAFDLVFSQFIFIGGDGGEGGIPDPLAKTDDLVLDGNTISADSIAKIKAAKAGSVVKIYVQNNSGGDRTNWGIGSFGGFNIQGLGGESFEIDIPVASISGNGITSQNDCVVVKAELWQ